MNTLESLRSLSPCSGLISQLILITFCLSAPVLVIEVSAQTAPSGPVARLITSTSDGVSYPRPRRVSAGNARRSEVPSPAAFPSTNQATETERRAFAATNEMRAKNGVSPLNWDTELCRMARAHSERMARLGFSLTKHRKACVLKIVLGRRESAFR